MQLEELKKHYTERLEAIIDLIREVVDIESPSGDADRSREVVRWVENEFRRTGTEFEIERFANAEFGEHIVIRAFPGEAKPVLLLGHTDTVHPVGTQVQNPARIEGDKFYGCGIFDMKANIVLMIEAFRYFAASGIKPARPINILLSCDEEVGSHTGREFVEKEAALAEKCYVFEPSFYGKVKTGRKGTGMYVVKAHGIPSHAGLAPEKGASAILEIARQIDRLHQLNDLSIGTTVNVCTAEGGTTGNVIPEHAEFSIDVRFMTQAEAERVDNAIRNITPFDARVTLDVTGGINRPPMERTAAVVSLFEEAKATAAKLGFDLGETQVGGASDGNFVGALGVPVLDGLGIAGDGAHTLHEHIIVSDIANRAALITSLLV